MKRFLFIAIAISLFATGGAFGNRGTARNNDFARAGDIGQFAIPFSALLYTAVIGDWQGAKQFGFSTTSTLAVTYALKYTVRAERPYQDKGAKGHSFPSGHTAFAFAGAGYWQRRYGWWVGVPMYAAASAVGYSRVFSRNHNWADVVAGAAIGTGFNYLFTTRYVPKGTQIAAVPTEGGAMLRFNSTF
ncbi:MAG: phosphatase PAP2 family protein [Alphaproteobacteria bacterium]|nr:phosphatase PAP2 family protein [Alphaproteobacteria bacterium]